MNINQLPRYNIYKKYNLSKVSPLAKSKKSNDDFKEEKEETKREKKYNRGDEEKGSLLDIKL